MKNLLLMIVVTICSTTLFSQTIHETWALKNIESVLIGTFAYENGKITVNDSSECDWSGSIINSYLDKENNLVVQDIFRPSINGYCGAMIKMNNSADSLVFIWGHAPSQFNFSWRNVKSNSFYESATILDSCRITWVDKKYGYKNFLKPHDVTGLNESNSRIIMRFKKIKDEPVVTEIVVFTGFTKN